MTPAPFKCECVGGHTAVCRKRKERALHGRASRGYVVTAEDLAIAARVAAADPLPDRYFAGQRMIVHNTAEE